ncbi:hypothetical protein GCM10011578_098140 [Streptomyces fuscichromogenes]|uniref:Uncharacterized protein n=1 Tax=Streptomyces fuscichromogenes TaxID=1324013 RepID=A0A917XQ08_9ACTN|nr:hypothetical protein GCM10011578_098140 [Streptomyces fuscichromogenes]
MSVRVHKRAAVPAGGAWSGHAVPCVNGRILDRSSCPARHPAAMPPRPGPGRSAIRTTAAVTHFRVTACRPEPAADAGLPR